MGLNISKTHIWYSVEADFLGITGVNTFDEAAEVLLHDGGHHHMFLGDQEETIENLRQGVRDVGMRAMAVPAAILHHELWDSSHMHFIAETDRPGRGYVKVFGCNF